MARQFFDYEGNTYQLQKGVDGGNVWTRIVDGLSVLIPSDLENELTRLSNINSDLLVPTASDPFPNSAPAGESTAEETPKTPKTEGNCKKKPKDPKIPESNTSGKTIIQADPCKDNTLARVEAYLTNFFDKVTKVGNAILNLPNEINFVVDLIGSTITGFVNKLLGSLNDRLSKEINNGIKALTALLISKKITIPAIIAIQTPLANLVKNLQDGLFCAATKILEGAKSAIKDLIQSSIKNVLNAGRCVVEHTATIEIEGKDKPAAIAEPLTLFIVTE